MREVMKIDEESYGKTEENLRKIDESNEDR